MLMLQVHRLVCESDFYVTDKRGVWVMWH